MKYLVILILISGLYGCSTAKRRDHNIEKAYYTGCKDGTSHMINAMTGRVHISKIAEYCDGMLRLKLEGEVEELEKLDYFENNQSFILNI